jgi:hypothetical protein
MPIRPQQENMHCIPYRSELHHKINNNGADKAVKWEITANFLKVTIVGQNAKMNCDAKKRLINFILLIPCTDK